MNLEVFDPEEVLKTCQELVRIPSLPGEEGQVAAVAAARMAGLGYDRVEVDAYGSVIGQVWGAEPGPTLLLDGHLDVVPVADPGDWTHDPWGAEIAEGRVWGRGAADTKGSLAGMLLGAGRFPRARLQGRVIVVASVGEENLTGAAIGPLLDRFQPQAFVTGEPTGLRLGVAQKGRITVEGVAYGRSAHTSQPELGENAAYKLIAAISRLRDLPLPSDPQLGPAVLELTEIVSEPLPGTSFVPHTCRARWIGRTLPGERAGEVLVRLRQALDGLPGVELRLSRLRQDCYTGAVLEAEDWLPGWRRPPGDPWTARLLEALAGAGLPDGTWQAPCGTNASAAAARGLPAFIYGPGSLAQAHTADEWVLVEELLAGAMGFMALIRAVCGPQP